MLLLGARLNVRFNSTITLIIALSQRHDPSISDLEPDASRGRIGDYADSIINLTLSERRGRAD
jgi:hypothetical protein